MDTVLITGGLGFTGRHIVAALRRGGRRVVSYNRDFATSTDPEVVPVQGELFDIPRLTRVLQDHGVSGIVHTAAMSHPTLSLDFPVGTFAANVEGTLGVFEAARLAGVGRVVNFSSETVYGAVDGPVDEATPVAPSTPYALTKVTTEWLGHIFGARYGLEVVSLRIAQVYGPGNRMPEILGDMLKAVVRGQPFALDRGADHAFNFIYVEDVADAALAALAAGGPPRERAYNVSSSEYWRLADVVDLVRGEVPGAEIAVGPGLDGQLDLQGPFSIEAAARDLGFAPGWPLGRGMRAYGAWLRDHDA